MTNNRQHSQPVPNRFCALGASLAITLGLSAVAIAPANAHDALIGSDPADGATLTETTDTITLSFNNDIAEIGGKVKISSDAGREEEHDLTANDKEATLTLDQPFANGEYTVEWRVVSSDSHPIDGDLTFTVDDPSNVPAETPEPEEPEVSEPAPEETSEPAPQETTSEPTPFPSDALIGPTPDASNTQAQGGVNWSRIALFGGLGALAGALLTYFTRKRSNGGDGSGK